MLRELAIMNKLYHVLFTMCYLASSSTHASCGKRGSFVVKPVGNITLHKRTLSGTTSQSAYLGNSTQNAQDSLTFEQLVRNFVQHPFDPISSDYGSSYFSDNIYFSDDMFTNANYIYYLKVLADDVNYPNRLATFSNSGEEYPCMPGEVFLDRDLNLMRTTTSYQSSLASADNAILGSKIYFVDSTSASDGQHKIPVSNLGTVNDTGTEFNLYPVIDDGLTHKYPSSSNSTFSNSLLTRDEEPALASYNIDGAGTVKLTLSHSNIGELTPKLYSQPRDLTAKYYLVKVGSIEDFTGTDVITNRYRENSQSQQGSTVKATNNYRHLIADEYFNVTTTYNVANEYTQKDYEQVNYYSLDLGVSGEYSISDFMTISGYAGLSSPIESIDHNGRFIELNPEIELSAKAGVMFGNQNGSIGLMYGLNYERFSTTLKRLVSTLGNDNVSSERLSQNFEETYTVSSLVGVIKITDSLEATFSTAISEKDLSIEMSNVQNTSLINQAYSVGVSLCL